MTPERLKQRYQALRRARDHGELSEAGFGAEIDGLRYRDERGAWHRLDPDSGRWLRWAGEQWEPEPEPTPPTSAPAPARPDAGALPNDFRGLAWLILKNTLKAFFRRLPLTLLFAAGALVLHTYLLVKVNNGFDLDPSRGVGHLLALRQSQLSGVVIWTLGSTLLMGLFARLRGRSGPGLVQALGAVAGYFRHAGRDAAAVALGSIGVALTVGALVTGHANLFMAAGVGALLASRSGAVTALLFRSAWTAVFSLSRRGDVARYGLAAGYVTLFASSLGFVANAALTPYGVAVGVLLLAAAVGLARSAAPPSALALLWLPMLALALGALVEPGLLLADDGGFNDPGSGDGTWPGWWRGQGRDLAIALGIGPALGAALGPLFMRVLSDLAAQLPPDLGTPSTPPLLDEDGQPLEQRDDGRYRWDVGDRTEWLTRDEARQRVQEELDARRERQRSQDQFWREAGTDPRRRDQQERPEWSLMNRPSPDHDWDPENGRWVLKDELYQRRMQREGYQFDPYSQAWRKPPEDITRVELPPEQGDASRPGLTPGFWGYDADNDGLDHRYGELDQAERDAIDAYRRAAAEADQARAAGDAWLAEQWDQRKGDAKDQVGDIQRHKDDLTRRVGEREQRAQDAERSQRDWKVKDVAKDLAGLPYHLIKSAVAPDMSDLAHTVEKAVAARNRLQAQMDAAPGLWKQHQSALDELQRLRQQVNDARSRGDAEAEARLRDQAAGVGERLNGITDQLNGIHDASNRWQLNAWMANLQIVKTGGQMAVEGMSVRGTASTVNNLIDQYRRGNLPGQYANRMSTAGDPDADLPGFSRKPDLDPDDLGLHNQANANRLDGARAVATWQQSSTPVEAQKNVIDVLQNRQSKLQLKDAPPDVKRQFAQDTWNHRTQPLFQETAERLNQQGAYVVQNGQRRPLSAEDFASGSGPGPKGPGVDLDMYSRRTIYDADGRPLKPQAVDGAIDAACDKLNFNRAQQEIHYTHPTDPDAYRLKPGMDPEAHLAPHNVRQWDAEDGDLAHRITQHKGRDLAHLNEADRIEEVCRGGIKDYERITRNLADEHSQSQVHPDLQRARQLMDDVVHDRRSVGEANSLCKQELGMDLGQAADKLSSLQESIPKLDPTGPAVDRGLKRFVAEMDDVAQRVREPPRTPGDAKVEAAEAAAAQLRRGEVPEGFGERRVGPDVESKQAWEDYDAAQGLPRRGNTHAAPEQMEARERYLEQNPRLQDIDQKVNQAWSEARLEKRAEILARERAVLIEEGHAPDAPDFADRLAQRVDRDHLTEQLDCWDKFERNVDRMVDQRELGESDYAAWQGSIGREIGAVDPGTAKAPGLADRAADFD